VSEGSLCFVIPAKAGIQADIIRNKASWIPPLPFDNLRVVSENESTSFQAGMTELKKDL
jgi:hypothetical protein